jgi:hypothetical protein
MIAEARLPSWSMRMALQIIGGLYSRLASAHWQFTRICVDRVRSRQDRA